MKIFNKIKTYLSFTLTILLCGCIFVDFSDARGRQQLERKKRKTNVDKRTNNRLVEAYDLYVKQEYVRVIPILAGLLNSSKAGRSEDQIYYLLGLSYQASDQIDDALICFDRLIYQNTAPYYHMKALISKADYYFSIKQYHQAERYYEQAISLNITVEDLDRVYLALADIAMQNGEQNKAQSYWQRVLKDTPTRHLKNKASALLKQLKAKVYSVQVGAFQTKKNARLLSTKLKKKGYDAFVVMGKKQGKSVYKVRVGRLSDKEASLRLGRKIQINEQIKGSVVYDALLPVSAG